MHSYVGNRLDLNRKTTPKVEKKKMINKIVMITERNSRNTVMTMCQ